jgi:glycosyltransferase involved in cell wall biosynthesis
METAPQKTTTAPVASQERARLRLVIASDNFLPRWDGVARFLAEMLPHLAKSFDVTVIAPDYGPAQHEGYRLVRIPVRRKRIGDYQPAMFRYRTIKREVARADIVFTQSIGPIGALAIIAAKRQRKPIVTYIHSLEMRLVPMAIGPNPLRALLFPFMRFFTRRIYNKATLLITPSEWVDDQLTWNGIRAPKRVVRLGVDAAKFSPGSGKETRERLGIASHEIVFGQHGRLAHEKDLKTLLRAFIRLRTKRKDVRLVIVADGIPSLKKALAAQEGVILPGKQDDVVPYLRMMDVFVLTSLTETTCLAALEAMSCGKPIVSTPVGFVRDYIKDGENGFFVKFKDPYRLAKKMQWLADHPEAREKVGHAARQTVLKSFSWEDTAKGIEEALKDTADL